MFPASWNLECTLATHKPCCTTPTPGRFLGLGGFLWARVYCGIFVAAGHFALGVGGVGSLRLRLLLQRISCGKYSLKCVEIRFSVSVFGFRHFDSPA